MLSHLSLEELESDVSELVEFSFDDFGDSAFIKSTSSRFLSELDSDESEEADFSLSSPDFSITVASTVFSSDSSDSEESDELLLCSSS
jgi:hypothetical protein